MANNNDNIRSGDVQQQQPYHQAPESVQVMHNFLQNFLLVSNRILLKQGLLFVSHLQYRFCLPCTSVVVCVQTDSKV